MPRRRRVLYGWLRKPGEWCLSREPPDVPVPCQIFASMEEAEQAAVASRYDVVWSGAALVHKQMMAAAERQ